MTREEVFEGLKEVISVIRPSTDLTNVNMDTELVRELGIDSLSMVILALAVEEKFGMRFDGQPAFSKVGDVCDYVVKATA